MKSTNLKSYVALLLALSLSTSYAVAKNNHCMKYEGPYDENRNKIGAQVSGELSWSITDGVIKFHDNKSAYSPYYSGEQDSRDPIRLDYIDYMKPYFLADMIEIKQNGPHQVGFTLPTQRTPEKLYKIDYGKGMLEFQGSYLTNVDDSNNFTYLRFDLLHKTDTYFNRYTYEVDIKAGTASMENAGGDINSYDGPSNNRWSNIKIFHLTRNCE